ncbi:hypothetical protein L3V77_10555 [Vibrio sp. DW001]|uniref:DUF7683 domain-containing protein n=1 Tax=Vibrio sp. DW001 TaxID=2912315 RepID=UPI0023B0302A|nr:hypothetical protein [Vibrio sp. DW001]WED25507.1 hypothetical protein L3V77_10555 [Vibrio sp. DW001]
MSRVIRYFDKVTEDFVDEITLPDIALKELQESFGTSSDDPMYEVFPIGEQNSIFLKRYVDVNFDFVKFDYFLDYDAD